MVDEAPTGKHESTVSTPILTGNVYDKMKFVAQIVLPAFGTLYFALATIWGLPDSEQVVGSITAVDAFLGVVLGISQNQYNNSDAKYDGDLVAINHDGDQALTIALNASPETLMDKNQVLFKVVQK